MGKRAFTLAEVLITLGIVGVVAAITMPTLIANYQKTVIVNQLKKSYSMWEQALQKILADEGVERLSDTQLWGYLEGYGCCNTKACGDSCGRTQFIPGLKKYIKFDTGMGKTGYGSYKNDVVYLIKTNDGTVLRDILFVTKPNRKDASTCNIIKELGGNMCSNAGSFAVDVNGDKGPNIRGKDIFTFYLSDEGKLYPYAGKDFALYQRQTDLSANTSYWKNSFIGCDPSKIAYEYQSGCAARIIENGWKMDY